MDNTKERIKRSFLFSTIRQTGENNCELNVLRFIVFLIKNCPLSIKTS
jgi:hypothetical protein